MAASRDLSHAQILAAALELLEERGLPEFSVRSLAERLGVGAAALRWHIGSRDRLLVDVVDTVLADLHLPDPETLDWRAWLRSFAASLRSTLKARPHLAPIVRDLMGCAPRSLDISAACQHVLRTAGYRDVQLLEVYNAYIGFVIGFNFVELTQRAVTSSLASDSDLIGRLQATATAHPSPLVQEMIAQGQDAFLVSQAEAIVDSAYRAGLEGLMAGLPAPAVRGADRH
ncbi:MAG: TetR family transcriptional regulator [Actinobacteria bacterium]|nr:TetR family transcriptional regulator [Actinomycetota bacterium]MCA1722491.1 TetR family transcriptional regulator [Actinomycetota bacterium]